MSQKNLEGIFFKVSTLANDFTCIVQLLGRILPVVVALRLSGPTDVGSDANIAVAG